MWKIWIIALLLPILADAEDGFVRDPGNDSIARAVFEVNGGTGFFVSPDGLFVTNRHVLAMASTQSVEISLSPHNYVPFDPGPIGNIEATAELLYMPHARNETYEGDFAILKLDLGPLGIRNVHVVELESVEPQIGRAVEMIGYPDLQEKALLLRLNRQSSKDGIPVRTSGQITTPPSAEYVLEDSPISLFTTAYGARGFSGGPIVSEGRVIGFVEGNAFERPENLGGSSLWGLEQTLGWVSTLRRLSAHSKTGSLEELRAIARAGFRLTPEGELRKKIIRLSQAFGRRNERAPDGFRGALHTAILRALPREGSLDLVTHDFGWLKHQVHSVLEGIDSKVSEEMVRAVTARFLRAATIGVTDVPISIQRWARDLGLVLATSSDASLPRQEALESLKIAARRGVLPADAVQKLEALTNHNDRLEPRLIDPVRPFLITELPEGLGAGEYARAPLLFTLDRLRALNPVGIRILAGIDEHAAFLEASVREVFREELERNPKFVRVVDPRGLAVERLASEAHSAARSIGVDGIIWVGRSRTFLAEARKRSDGFRNVRTLLLTRKILSEEPAALITKGVEPNWARAFVYQESVAKVVANFSYSSAYPGALTNRRRIPAVRIQTREDVEAFSNLDDPTARSAAERVGRVLSEEDRARREKPREVLVEEVRAKPLRVR